jgi:serine/threonine protein kinase
MIVHGLDYLNAQGMMHRDIKGASKLDHSPDQSHQG